MKPEREALCVFAGLALVYLFYRCPSYGPGDSAQHALSAMTWGVSRAPGYPMYTAVANLFARLGGLSWVGAFSGLAQAGAAGLLHLYLRRKGCGLAAAAAAGTLIWLSPLQWYYAMIPEVRGLNHLLAAAAACAALAWAQGARRSESLLGAVVGLGLSHHPTFLFIVPAVLVLACEKRPTRPQAARAFGAMAVFWALPYILLWGRLAFGAPPLYNADGVSGAAGVAGLFLRKGTGGLLSVAGGQHSSFSLEAFGRQLAWYGRTLAVGLTPVGLILSAVGIFALRERRREQLSWLVWGLLPVVVYAALASGQLRVEDADYAYAIAARFHLLPMMAMAALAAYGAELLSTKVRPAIINGLAVAAVLGALIRPVNLRAHEPTRKFAMDILSATKPGDGIILDSDDAISSLLYETVAGGSAPRVLILPAMASYEPYRRRLAAGGSVQVPPEFTDWAGWLKLNPTMELWAEGTLRPSLEKDYPLSAPDGPLIRLPRKALKDSIPAARRFLDSSLGRLTKGELMDGTQELVLARGGAALAHWYISNLQNAKAPTDLVQAVEARLMGFW